MGKNFCIFYAFLICLINIFQAQEIYISGEILFYYNNHPAGVTSIKEFYALDSVRVFSREKKYAVWADYAQSEHFTLDVSIDNLELGKLFNIWISVPQFCDTAFGRNNYEHKGGNCYRDRSNDIIIAFKVEGIAKICFQKEESLCDYVDKMSQKEHHTNEKDSILYSEEAWYDIKTFYTDDYIVFLEVKNTVPLSRKERKKFKLKKIRMKSFLLYGSV